MIHKKKIGLALSGGGYRATACHIGTLRKLNELGILDKIDVISSISGGSILSAYYCLHKDDYEAFEKGAIAGVGKSVIGYVLRSWQFILLAIAFFGSFAACALLRSGLSAYLLVFIAWLFLIAFFQFKLLPLHILIPQAYDKFFFQRKKLKDFPKKPVIAINSTNIESGRQFTFSGNRMGDSYYDYPEEGGPRIRFDHDNFPISKAVYASSCVPFIFVPLKIDAKYLDNPADKSRVSPLLIDGGIYDNQGIHKITQKESYYGCDYIIVSDAGVGDLSTKGLCNSILLIARTCNLFMHRIKNLQKTRSVYCDAYDEKRIAYYSLKSRPKDCVDGFLRNLKEGVISKTVCGHHGIDDSVYDEDAIKAKLESGIKYNDLESQFLSAEELSIVRNVGTNLTALKKRQIDALIKQSAILTEIYIRLYCPDLIVRKTPKN